MRWVTRVARGATTAVNSRASIPITALSILTKLAMAGVMKLLPSAAGSTAYSSRTTTRP